MTLWARHFDAARFSGGEPGVGNFTEGDLSPERSVQYLSYAAVTTYAPFASFVAQAEIEVEATAIRNVFEFRKLPRVQCYLGSLGGDLVPTGISTDSVRVYWAIRMAWNDTFGQLSFGEPSFDSLRRLIFRALVANKQLTFDVNGVSCPLARLSNQDGEVNYLLDIDETGNRRAVTLETPWTYGIKTDVETGGLAQLA